MKVVSVLILSIALFVACVEGLTPIHVEDEVKYGFLKGDIAWLGTMRDGIFIADLETGRVDHLYKGNGLPINETTCGISALGRIWIGSDSGLWVSAGGGNWDRVPEQDLPSPRINCLAAQGGSIWVGTNRGAARYDSESDRWTKFTVEDGLSGNWILTIEVEGSSVWFGSMRGGVCRHDAGDGSWSSWEAEDGLISNTVFSISVSPEYLVAGTTGGISIMDRSSSTWINYGSEYLPSPSIYATVWVAETGEAWFGTGAGIAVWDSDSRNITTIAKIGEIEVGRVNDLISTEQSVLVLRSESLWFKHSTTTVLIYDLSSSSWLRPIMIDVLVDQSGYGPGHPKSFIVQSNEPIEGEGRFEVASGAGKEVYGGSLSERVDREDWDAYYWRGDFTPLELRGNFTVEVELGEWAGRSYRFEIDNDALLEDCGELVYEFLRYMRCGVAHEYRPSPCHLDDALLPNGTHIDATGGWHCAGLWGGKYSRYHTYVLFNVLLAMEYRPDFFGPIDRDGDGLADILNEAMWGCDYLLKMQENNGSIHHEVKKIEETDGIIGTKDDRPILGWAITRDGLLAVAGWAGTSALVAEAYPEEAISYLRAARTSLNLYGRRVAGGMANSVEGAAMVLACAQMFRATSNRTYLEMAEHYCNLTLGLGFSGYYATFVPVALGQYLEINPSTVWREEIVSYIAGIADSRIAGDTSASNPHTPFQIPTWRLYIIDPWAAESLMAYRLTGNLTYLEHGIGLVDCHLGVNPYDMCMLEGAGTYNSPGYASYFRSPTNPRGTVPGSIPQGIRWVKDRPIYDISINPNGKSAETWLINTNLLQPLCLIPEDNSHYPLEVGENLYSPPGLLLIILILSGLSRGLAPDRDTSP